MTTLTVNGYEFKDVNYLAGDVLYCVCSDLHCREYMHKYISAIRQYQNAVIFGSPTSEEIMEQFSGKEYVYDSCVIKTCGTLYTVNYDESLCKEIRLFPIKQYENEVEFQLFN